MNKLGFVDRVNRTISVCMSQEESYRLFDNYESPNLLEEAIIIYFDGAGTNGEFSRVCFGKHNEMLTLKIDPCTNNEAEYKALINALKMCKENETYILIGDSQLIINQVLDIWGCKENRLRVLRDEARELMQNLDVFFHWVPRDLNNAGIELERIKC